MFLLSKEAENVDHILSLDVLPEEYNEQNKPYLGVPFSCKESVFVKDMPCTSGSFLRKDFLAPEDSNAVKYLREAGAILLCTTNVSEFNMWLESRNLIYGISRNPYNLSRLVGGSTGGEGGILSACGSLVGVGGDVAGSIRMPGLDF
jgi:fatty acid amide hydrolase 2